MATINVDYDIQYRANKKYPNCLVKCPDDDIPYNERQSLIRMGYIKGATDQHNIDTDKACEWLINNADDWLDDYIIRNQMDLFISVFRAAMKE